MAKDNRTIKKHWAAFRKCLRKTLCTTVNSRSPGLYELDECLGGWFIKPRTSMHQCYTAKCGLYWRINEEFFL
jgi:hypothetical protein